MANLWVRKSIADLKAEAAESDEHGLKRTLTGTNLIMLGIGAIIGAGFFGLTGEPRRSTPGRRSPLSFVLGGIVCAFAGLCYAEMASTVPVAGSAYTYAYATMGEFIAWLIGWDLILEYMVGATTVAINWSGYVASFLHDRGHRHPGAVPRPRPARVMIEVPDAVADELHLRHGWSMLDIGQGRPRRRPGRLLRLSPAHGDHQPAGDGHRRAGHGACWSSASRSRPGSTT